MKKKLFFISMLLIVGSSLAIGVERVLEAGEESLKTKKDLLTQFHSVLYYPSEISLDFPGFIVGIEKSPVNRVVKSKKDILTTDILNSGENKKGYKKRLIDEKIMFISHIVENYNGHQKKDNYAIYNAYYRKENIHPTSIDYCKGSTEYEVENGRAYTESWKAITRLKERVTNELAAGAGTYTHILVVSMGWNTAQEEAIRNFNSLVKNITNSSKNERFKPLFIGVTWPSLWDSAWFDPIHKLTSYPVKANDADEVGFSWLGAVLHDSLNEPNNKLPIIVIGHSFGARTTSMAACVGPAITNNGNSQARNTIDLLISLQGAYSINRFFIDKGSEEISYPAHCSNVSKIVLTSSKYDKAIDTGFWVNSVGNDKTFNKYCKKRQDGYHEKSEHINCVDVTSSQEVSLGKKRIQFLNADSLIKYKSYMTGGGAHSDIYRKEMGKLLWKIINEYTGR